MKDKRQRLLTVANTEIYYLSIAKSGCTFVKNVLWQMNFGERHPEPLRIHRDQARMPTALGENVPLGRIMHSTQAFTVIRNPVDRLVSLYTDKMIGNGQEHFLPLRDIVAGDFSLNASPSTEDAHFHNIECLALWIRKNLAGETDLPPNPHWTPQAKRSGVMREFDLRILTMDNLNEQIPLLMERARPGSSASLLAHERNRSDGPAISPARAPDGLKDLILEIYGKDQEIFSRARDIWANSDKRLESIPAFSRVA